MSRIEALQESHPSLTEMDARKLLIVAYKDITERISDHDEVDLAMEAAVKRFQQFTPEKMANSIAMVQELF